MDQGPDTELARGVVNETMAPMQWLQNLDPAILMRLLGGLLGGGQQQQPPGLRGAEQPQLMGLKGRMLQAKNYPPRAPDDLSGMGY